MDLIGRTLDRYRIDSKLGEGGMGVVYKAYDTQLDRDVAIKILPPDKVSDPERKRRFIQEAKAASALNHPGIITIHDIRSEAGVDFIVMECVAGKTLDQIIPAKGLAPPEALRYAVEIAEALSQAHAAGIVHRDLKPSNVMVTVDGRVKLLDFGLAKLLDAEDDAIHSDARTTGVTAAGIVVGTAAYMSPEQAEGRHVDARSDIFSFGAMLYEMVTGRRPFLGESPLAVLARILHDDPMPPSQLVATISPELERTIQRCVRKDPARRYQTMADLKVALDDLVDEASPRADVRSASRTARPSKPKALRWMLVGIGAVPLLALAWYFAPRGATPAEPPAPLRAVPITSATGVKRSPSFSADGNQLAFAWTGPEQNNNDIYVQQVGSGAPVRLTTDPADDYSPIWSPDGRQIAFLRRQDPRRHDLRLISPLGGPERKLVEIHPHAAFLRLVTLAWCPDSSCIITTDSSSESKPDALYVISIESGERRQLTIPEHPVMADTDPDVSPDGNWLVFRRDTAPFNGELYRARLDKALVVTGAPTRLTSTGLYAYNPRWMADSARILFSARGSLWSLAMSTGAVEHRLPFVGEDGVTPTLMRAPPGQPTRMAYVRSFSDQNLWGVDMPSQGKPTASPPRPVVMSTRRDANPALSPDGQRLTFTSDRSGEFEFWVADRRGNNAVQLTSMRANPGFPQWSPDSELIAFHSNPDGQAEVYVIPAAGGRPRNVTSHPAVDVFPSFSRDGRWIYFSSNRSGEPMIWKLPTTGGDAVQVSKEVGQLAIESVDGADLYYVASPAPDRPGPLMRMPTKGGPAIKIADDVVSTSFRVLDGGIYYFERQANVTRLRYFDLVARQSILVAQDFGNVFGPFTASSDGREIIYSRADSVVDDMMLVENFH